MIDPQLRTFQFRIGDASQEGDGLTLEGHAAVFDQWTEIEDWLGMYRESFKKGAFRKTLKERTPVLQFDHGSHPLVGSIPLGSFEELKEDDTGLYVRARLHDNWLTQPVRDAIQSGSIPGMSIRFQTIKDQRSNWDHPTEAERIVTEVRLFELGPVVFPAYEGTDVGVRELLARSTQPNPLLLERLVTPAGGGSIERDTAATIEDETTTRAEPEISEGQEPTARITPAERRKALLRMKGIVR